MAQVWWLRPVSRQRARRRAHRRGVEATVAQALGGEAVERRRGDVGAEAAELREADVVEHDQHDVGRALGRATRHRPGGRGLDEGGADPTGERLVVVVDERLRHAAV